MEHKNVSTVTRRFKQTFCEGVLNALGKTVRFCHRVREITPYRLALGLMEVFAATRVETIADAHRAFNALCNTTVQYKPFHNQLAKSFTAWSGWSPAGRRVSCWSRADPR